MSLNDDCQIESQILFWINIQRQATLSQPPLYSLEYIMQSRFIQQTLNFLDSTYFPIEQSGEILQISQKIEVYLDKQFGKRLNRTIRKEMINNERKMTFLKLILFLCVQSKEKNQYISRIMQLPSAIQSKLMEDIQQISSNLENVLETKEILKQMEVLEEENQNLKLQVQFLKDDEKKYQRSIKDWEEEAQKLAQQVEKYRKQKQKVIESLHLIDFDDYLDLFRKLQQENQFLSYSIQQNEQKNYLLSENCEEMKIQIKENSIVIAELNEEIHKTKDLYFNLKLEKSYFEETVDATRSFGKVIQQNTLHQGSRTSRTKYTPKVNTSLTEICEEGENPIDIIPLSLKETSNQMGQLRQYNSEIMQKLESCYKNINFMNIEVSNIREKNAQLEKQTRFYKKQIKDIKKLHKQLELNFENGDI